MTGSLRNSRLAFAGVAAFVATLLAAAPASMLAPVLDRASGLSYTALEGRVWSGRIVGLRHAGAELGDVGFSVRPSGLLQGALVVAFDARGGALTGAGELRSGVMGRLELRRADLTFDLSSIRRYTLFGLPYSGDLHLDVEHIVATASGCVDAEMTVRTSILDAAAVQHVGEGLVLEGPVSCEDGDLLAGLSGENAIASVRVEARVLPTFSYQLEAIVTPKRNEAVADLRRLGFEPEDGAFTFGAAGALQGLGS